MADPKRQLDHSNQSAGQPEGQAVSNNGGRLQQILFDAFLRKQEQVRRHVDHAGRLAAVLAVQQEIGLGDLELEEVLRLVTARAVSILGATGAAVALERGGVMVCRATAGATGPGLGAHLADNAGLSAACLRTGQIMQCEDSEADSRIDGQAARTLGIRSMVVTPLFRDRVTVGVLEVFSAEPHFFEEEDNHVIELLSGLLTIAIGDACELEAEQTLQSDRGAVSQVLEEIRPAIEKIFRQSAEAVEGVFSPESAERFGTGVVEGPAAGKNNPSIEVEPSAGAGAATAAANGVSDWESFTQPPGRAQAESVDDYQSQPAPEPPPGLSTTALPEPIMPVEDDFESSEPEPPPPVFPGGQQQPLDEGQYPSPMRSDELGLAPATAKSAESQLDNAAQIASSIPHDIVSTPPIANAKRQPSPFMAWAASWKVRLRGSNEGAASSNSEGVTQARNEFRVPLPLRNLMEYAIPAVFTGVLIVVGLQWMVDRGLASPDFGWGPLRMPVPSLGGGARPATTQVEISAYVSSRGAAPTENRRSGTNDWRSAIPKLGGTIGALVGAAPVPGSASNGDGAKLPSGAAPADNEAVAVVHLPEYILDQFLLVRVEPVYPPIAQERRLTGTVVLDALIARDGGVKEVHNVSGNRYLAESAVTAVYQWRYKPFVLNGKPIEVATELTIAFKRP